MTTPFIILGVVPVIVFVPMLFEARLAAGNERALFARGGIEPAGDVYRAMRVAYPAAFLAMMAERAIRGGAPPLCWFVTGSMTFAAAKLVKWWAVATLGPRWTFRVVVVPDEPRIMRGPYRFIRHPNYAGVVGELLGVLLMTGAILSGVIAIVVFGTLLARRIAIEERALGAILPRK